MKILNLLMWVTQFGISVVFPTLLFLWLAAWLQDKWSLGPWIFVVMGMLGVLTSLSTAKSCLRSMQKAAEELSDSRKPPIAFNDHE